ncbi:YBL054W [Saccharomyces arboricola H-6]|uniref:YBL054W n=1 Tax=Saccharomyces arboricola (strain H-6 / AS 2.3317 / CBS 10644) TaxID=1160507 RepID=J8Q7P6_SACAR|nr:YBL054W [Saccharomyces arboricola H-6]
MTLPKLSSVSVSSGHVSANSHGFSILSKHPHPNNLVHSHSLSHTNAKSPLSTVNVNGKQDGISNDEAESLKKSNPSSWDPSDDIKLRHLKEIKNLGWKEIAHHFPNRTPNACQFRWRRLKSGNLKSNKTAVIDITKLFGVYTTAAATTAAGAGTSVGSVNLPPTEEAAKDEAVEDEDITSGSSAIDDSPPDCKPMIKPKYMDRKLMTQRSTSTFLDHETPHTKSKKLFVKPRSFSHSIATNTPNIKTAQQTSLNFYNTPLTKTNKNINSNDYENIGLVPKIIIRSRRNSFIPSTQISHSTIKSRKNSHSVISSRRSSFNMRRSSFNSHAPTEPISRRASLVVSPYMSPRRLSTSQPAHHHPQQQYYLNPITSPNCKTDHSNDRIMHTRTFLDMQKFANKHPWSREDDEVLLNNTIGKQNHLSALEISIVLPNNRSELEIQQRIDYLKRKGQTNGFHRSQRNEDEEEEDIDPLHREADTNNSIQQGQDYRGSNLGHGSSKPNDLTSMMNMNDLRTKQDELPGINSIFKNIF